MFGTPFKIGLGLFQNLKANKIKPQWQEYQTNPFASKRLGLANNMFNGRMAGAANAERNIFSNNANFMSNVQRNATDASQALSLAAAGQGQTDQALTNLGTAEAQNKYAMLGNLNNAYAQMITEGDKVFQNKMDKFKMDTAQKNALRNAGINNIASGVDSIDAAIQQVAGAFLGGGLPMGSMGAGRRTSSGVGYAPDFDNYGQPG